MRSMNLSRLLIVLVLVGIVASMGSALFQLTRQGGDSRKMLRALQIRVALSVGLFVILLVAWRLGHIQPHGVGR
jgi:cytochrome bd-type quinol oxidase subunit 2